MVYVSNRMLKNLFKTLKICRCINSDRFEREDTMLKETIVQKKNNTVCCYYTGDLSYFSRK